MLTVYPERIADAGTFVVSDEPCVLAAIIIKSDGTNNVVLNVYDWNEKTSGTHTAKTKLIPKLTVDASADYGGIDFNHPVRCRSGIVAVTTGSGSEVLFYLKKA